MQYDGMVWLEKNLPYVVDEKILLHTTKLLENIIGIILLNNVSLIFFQSDFCELSMRSGAGGAAWQGLKSSTHKKWFQYPIPICFKRKYKL